MKTRLVILAISVFAGKASAQSLWVPTAGGTTYDWNVPANWSPSGFPDAAGVIANLTNDIAGNQTIRLREAITLGTLNIGDNASNFTVGNSGVETFALTMDSGLAGVAAQINLSFTGAPTSSLAVPVVLNSNLALNFGTGSQVLTFSTAGSLDTGIGVNARTITMTGGTSGANQFNLNGNLMGAGVVINNSNTTIVMSNPKSFTGTFILNKGVGGTNTGSLAVTTGSIANASEVIINGHITAGITQNGGVLHAGNQALQANNPGQRLNGGRITLNSGTVSDSGQDATTGVANAWQQGLEAVQDNVSVMDFNSGFSHVTMIKGANTRGTILNIGTVERSFGASVYLKSETLGATNGSQFFMGNSSAFLKGAGGPEGSKTMSIIPWMAGNNTNAALQLPIGFATYTANGVRNLEVATEYETSLTAGATFNVTVGTFGALTGPATVNALRLTSTNNTSNIGAGQTLTIASGGLFFTSNNAIIGNPTLATAGTLQFGLDGVPTEAVIWTNNANVDRIGATITGSGGLSKAGTGTLILTGDNLFTGTSYIGGGTLQVGDGTNTSNLGVTGDVAVANGAVLSLMNDGAIADTALLRLEQYGLFNGKMSLGAGVNETVGALLFGDVEQSAGTYGSTLSSATFKDDARFSGTGMLTVVPEPGAAIMMLGGLGVIMARRRRRG